MHGLRTDTGGMSMLLRQDASLDADADTAVTLYAALLAFASPLCLCLAQDVALQTPTAHRDALLCETGHFWLPYHSAFRRGHYQAGLMHLQEVVRLCAKLTGSSSGSGSTAAAAADTSYRDDPRQLLVFTLQNEHFCREDGGRPSGHQLVMRACGELGLGQPRVLPQEKWEVKIDAKAVAKFRAKLLVLDAAEALQGLGLTQVPSGVGREGEEAPGSKRPRGG